jgi:hypothetical protein
MEKNGVQGFSKIGASHLTDIIPILKRPSNQWKKEYAGIRYAPIALHKVGV